MEIFCVQILFQRLWCDLMLSTDIKYLKTDAPTIFFASSLVLHGSSSFWAASNLPFPCQGWWHWCRHLPHPRQWVIHPRYQWAQQRAGAHAAELQRDGQVCGPRGRQAQGILRHVPWAFREFSGCPWTRATRGASASRRDGFLLCFWLEIKSYSCNSWFQVSSI